MRASSARCRARRVLELFRAGDASLLSSSWENFPHTVVEALAVGTPVIATRTGGVAEVLRDGVNGLVVEPGDIAALAAAIGRFFAEEGLAERLRAAAAPSVADYAPGRVYGRLEQILVVGRGMTPRVLFVGARRLPAAARPEPRAQVGRALGAARAARARERHRPRSALRSPRRPAARRAPVLRVAAGPGRARAADASGRTS